MNDKGEFVHEKVRNKDFKELLFGNKSVERNHEKDSKINFLNGRAYSQKYFSILEKRKNLPAWASQDQIIELVKQHQVLVLQGDTGSGKTTQVPQFLLQSGIVGDLQIACTQPRRVAAMSVAQRVADEMDVPLGEEVGYTIRFEDKTS